MLEQIREDGGDVEKYVAKAKDKTDNFRLMGFGHRVYKNFDPRATIIKAASDRLLNKMKIVDPLFDIAKKLEHVALHDEYFIGAQTLSQRRFLFGRNLPRLGIPVRMFTVLFAMGRLPGWIAHWKEMHSSNAPKICRPRQIYVGENERRFVSIDQRG